MDQPINEYVKKGNEKQLEITKNILTFKFNACL